MQVLPYYPPMMYNCVPHPVHDHQAVDVKLDNKDLWMKFHNHTNEMIITKLGRRMFPSVQVTVEGLDRRMHYCVMMEIVPSSRRRHKYVGCESTSGSVCDGESKVRGWTSAGAAEPQPPTHKRIYIHPDSPATGSHWMNQPINFIKLKLTNNVVDHHNNVVLCSMHKYIPKIWIILSSPNENMMNLFSQPSLTFTFPETEFIAVTAYQNESITKLKIDHNPFAKGFRETGKSCKRKLENSKNLQDEEDNSCDEQSCRSSTSGDSGVCSNEGSSPPPMIQEELQSKFYRPWLDAP
ncbi:GSCOCG00010097001-RA-CDS [Cotesia congregata]|nr:GSCOCG00010097001-RA-CDS [Cotesia congregata]